MIDTIIYDFDGTLMDTNQLIINSWQHTYRTLTGKEGNLETILKTFGEPLEYSMRNAFPDVPVDVSVETYRKWHGENFASQIDLFPGMLENLKEARARGYKLGMATSRLARSLYEGLDKFDIRKYFDAVVTADDVTRHKPDPESVNAVLKKLGSRPENAVLVGDSIHDMGCAHNAGVLAVLVAWSITLKDKKIEDFNKSEAPDFIIRSPEELFEVIRR